MGTRTTPVSRRVAIASVSAATTSGWRQSRKQVRGCRAVGVRSCTGHQLDAVHAFSLKWLLIGWRAGTFGSWYEVQVTPHPARAYVRRQQQQQRRRGFHSALASSLLLPNASPPLPSSSRRSKQCNRRPVVTANWNSSIDGTERSFESTALCPASCFLGLFFPNLTTVFLSPFQSHCLSWVAELCLLVRTALLHVVQLLPTCLRRCPLDAF